MNHLLQDVRYSFRRLRHDPGFTAVALLSLALGIGMNTAIFTLVNAVVLRDSGVRAPEELVEIYLEMPGFPTSVLSYPEFRAVEKGTGGVFAGVAASQLTIAQRDRGDRVEPVTAEIVSGGYFEVLGLSAAAGRLLTRADDVAPGGHPVIVLSHGYWSRAFDGDRAAIGSELRLNGLSYTVIGVTPASYEGNLRGLAPDVYFPYAMINEVLRSDDDNLKEWGNHSVFVKGRLRPGATLAQAEVALAAVEADLESGGQWTEANRLHARASTDVILFPPVDRVIRPAAGLLTAVVALVLLIACANLASFLLARAHDRRREIAIRLALGAGRWALVRQLLAETVLLALVGGALGVLVSVALLRLLTAADLPLPIPITLDLAPDLRVLGFTALISLAAGLAFGLVPALQSTNPDVAPTLKTEATGEPPRRFALRRVLVAGQVAVSLVLLVVAGLFMRSFQARQNVDPGFGTQPAAVVSFGIPAERYPHEQALLLLDRLRERVGALPGVEAVGFTSNLHLNPLNTQSRGLNVDGVAPPPGERSHSIDAAMVDAGFFDAVGIPLVRGRAFTADDDADADRVIIVNETFADRFWPGEDAVGRVVRSGDGTPLRIVGIARDARIRQLGEAPRAFAYLPLGQNGQSYVTLVARTRSDAAPLVPRVLEAARDLERDLIFFETKTMERHLAAMLLPARLGAIVLAAFAALALALALVGLYGVVGYAVASRRREVGIRMSLGARPGEMVRMLMGGGLRLVLVGAAIGLVLGLAASRVLARLLFGVPAADPLTFAVVPLAFAAVAAVAAYLPARRASRIDPVRVLRGD